MIERIETSRNGLPTAWAGSVCCHSRYDPQAEAERYAASLELPEDACAVILVEPALGYIISPIRRKFPGLRILAVHCSSFFQEAARQYAPDDSWSPKNLETLTVFLERNISEDEQTRVRVVPWKPSLRAYGDELAAMLRNISDFLKRGAANKRTVSASGRRWFRNALRNISLAHTYLLPLKQGVPVVVAGAGPGLERSIPAIRKAHSEGSIAVVAVSSSFPALYSQGIIPDLIVGTDGNTWALFHLWEVDRVNLNGTAIPLAASLTVAVTSRMASDSTLWIQDGSLWQSIIAAQRGLPPFGLPQRGTVAATAVDIARRLTAGAVYLAGFDLAHQDVRTHARPNALDRFREPGECRFNPSYSQGHARARAIEDSGALEIYAAWFKDHLADPGGRLCVLGTAHTAFNALAHRETIACGPYRKSPFFRTAVLDESEGKAAALEAVGALRGALSETGPCSRLHDELGELFGLEESKRTMRIIIDIAGSLAAT